MQFFRRQSRLQIFYRPGHPQCPRISRPSWRSWGLVCRTFGERERDKLRVQLQSDGRSEQRERKHMKRLPSNSLDLVPLPRASSAGSTIVDHVPGTVGGQSALMETLIDNAEFSEGLTDSTRCRRGRYCSRCP